MSKNKAIEQIKEIQKDFDKTGDVQNLINAVNKLPPEIQELFNVMKKRMENDKE